ncbi:MAG: DsbE family thiol:disulfide interchange protein [Gammaproteobacteria bacterium]|nr:DsbE family thiol:disulfide interchange protein [Gammaproteobacteria bacterium]
MKPGRLKYWLPAALFVILAGVLGIGLTLDPSRVPSPLVGKPAPTFELARLHEPETRFSSDEMRGRVWVLNVWASWCVGCREEHEVLQRLADENLAPIVGLNYKDKPGNARGWLNDHGDFFALSVMDRDGRVGIDWGVYGVPETFIIDRDGVIQYKHIGPVDYPALTQTVIPKIKSLVGES